LIRADHRVARDEAADGAVADRHQKCLVGDGRKTEHAIERVLDRRTAEIERPADRRHALDATRHLGRFAKDHR
jgi:hypothetical protein